MKLKFTCYQCMDMYAPKGGGEYSIPWDPNCIMELDDRDYYEFTCQNGHNNCFFLSMPRYTVLYDMGYCAFQNGFYREAVLDFAASYERFNEYCIYVMLWEKDTPIKKEIETIWKELARQSERQLGAFISLFYKTTNKMPTLMQNAQISFRNDVTHKGLFPTEEKTYEYALCVANYIKNNITEISDRFGFDYRGLYPTFMKLMKTKKKSQGFLFPTLITQYSCGNSFEQSVKFFNGQFKNHYQL